uniref:Reverse transcriptase domain-containing protein n=1 Tax=Tanacetum cinerariifolium TaxID=118510 RepID=A0A6L2K9T4_TANCI|nr:hypothetical protein [Tanacetum cinerariifolium]
MQDQVQGQRFHARLIKIQVAQKKVKIAFENADSSSRVEFIPSKIKMCYKVVLNFHKEFSVFSSFKGKGNDRLLQNNMFKYKEEVKMASKRGTRTRTKTTPASATATATTTPMTDAAIRALISQDVADALAG